MIKRTIELCMERKYNHDVGYLMIGNGEDISEKNIDVGEDEGFNWWWHSYKKRYSFIMA